MEKCDQITQDGEKPKYQKILDHWFEAENEKFKKPSNNESTEDDPDEEQQPKRVQPKRRATQKLTIIPEIKKAQVSKSPKNVKQDDDYIVSDEDTDEEEEEVRVIKSKPKLEKENEVQKLREKVKLLEGKLAKQHNNKKRKLEVRMKKPEDNIVIDFDDAKCPDLYEFIAEAIEQKRLHSENQKMITKYLS